ncbi:hypothetical protein [Streptosporangium canum]
MALVELSVMEQRYRAVLEVEAGCPALHVRDTVVVGQQPEAHWKQIVAR